MTRCHILTNLVSNKIPNFPLQVAKKRIILVFLVFVLLTLLMCGYYKYTLYIIGCLEMDAGGLIATVSGFSLLHIHPISL